MNKQWEHNLKLMISSVDRINGKCTENVGKVRDNSVKDWSAASLSPHTSALPCEMQVGMWPIKAAGDTHTYALTLAIASHRHKGMLGRVFIISDWAIPACFPQDTHTKTVVGGNNGSADSSLPLEILNNPLPGARPKSINGIYVMNRCHWQGNSKVNTSLIKFK